MLLIPALARIMISEAVNEPIPNRREHLYQKVFAERNPDVVHHQIAACEMLDRKILRRPNRFGVFRQAIVESGPGVVGPSAF